MRHKRTKILMESIFEPATSNWKYRIWDNGDIEDISINNSEIKISKIVNKYYDTKSLLREISTLDKSKLYIFNHWNSNPLVDLLGFKTHFSPYNNELDKCVLKFVNVILKCKECGFETGLNVCPNCGEWQT